ncbi:hypothetical protein ACU18_15390 [Arthrobacter sp. ZBG10]|uniref:hypothetical protein n=1 Tax=Arthrobacter sp. ZBG10 TaxID=1676590 RepID=UPI000681E46C|nr:hypothetical protein [Arthrobacter sp. ZBG10]KNH15987.1 hypothetical protein ACU18_15390 [Arthrobacter sp. ZBG10]
MDLNAGERSAVQAPEAVQAAAQRWAIMEQSPDYQDHVLGQVQANSPQAKEQLVKDWLAAGSPQVRPFDPEFLAAQNGSRTGSPPVLRNANARQSSAARST